MHQSEEGHIHGVVIVGPHECMPCKIAEAQYGAAAERQTLPYVSIGFNGDPMDEEALDRFAYDVHDAFGHHEAGVTPPLAAKARPTKGTRGAGHGRVRLPVIADAEE